MPDLNWQKHKSPFTCVWALPIADTGVIPAGITRLFNSIQHACKIPLGNTLKNSLSNERAEAEKCL